MTRVLSWRFWFMPTVMGFGLAFLQHLWPQPVWQILIIAFWGWLCSRVDKEIDPS